MSSRPMFYACWCNKCDTYLRDAGCERLRLRESIQNWSGRCAAFLRYHDDRVPVTTAQEDEEVER